MQPARPMDRMPSPSATLKTYHSDSNLSLASENKLAHPLVAVRSEPSLQRTNTNITESDQALWHKNPKEYFAVRKNFFHLSTEKINHYIATQQDIHQLKPIFLPATNIVHETDFTQPTMKSCNITSLMSALDDLLSANCPNYPTTNALEKFKYWNSNILSPDEHNKLFATKEARDKLGIKPGLDLKELTSLANRLLSRFNIPWTATIHSTADLSLDSFIEKIQQSKENGTRIIANLCAMQLFGRTENFGHYVHIDKIKISASNQVFCHPIMHASYRYPPDLYIPASDIYQAMVPEVDGTPRGIITLEKNKAS